MTAPKLRPEIEPLTLTWAEVAFAVYRKSENWLRDHAEEEFAKGLPRPIKALSLFYRRDIDRCLERWAGHDKSPADATERLIERAKRGIDQGALSRRP